MVIFNSYVKLPEGIPWYLHVQRCRFDILSGKPLFFRCHHFAIESLMTFTLLLSSNRWFLDDSHSQELIELTFPTRTWAYHPWSRLRQKPYQNQGEATSFSSWNPVVAVKIVFFCRIKPIVWLSTQKSQIPCVVGHTQQFFLLGTVSTLLHLSMYI